MGVAWYKTGTVSVTNGNKVVTGSGTNFSTVGQLNPGDIFTIDFSKLYEIDTVDSDGQITLVDAYTGTTASGQNFAIIPIQYTNLSNAAIAGKVAALLSSWQGREDEFSNWLSGQAGYGYDSAGNAIATPPDTANGGYYPMTDASGTTRYVKCPAQMSYDISTGWHDTNDVPTYVSANSFTVPGDQVSKYTDNTPIKCVDSSTLYGYISSSSYSSINSKTTVTVTLNSGSLSASLSAVALGVDASTQSIPPGAVRSPTGSTFYASEYGCSPSASAAKNDTAIANAIADCSAAGGGWVILPIGTISTSATINLPVNVGLMAYSTYTNSCIIKPVDGVFTAVKNDAIAYGSNILGVYFDCSLMLTPEATTTENTITITPDATYNSRCVIGGVSTSFLTTLLGIIYEGTGTYSQGYGIKLSGCSNATNNSTFFVDSIDTGAGTITVKGNATLAESAGASITISTLTYGIDRHAAWHTITRECFVNAADVAILFHPNYASSGVGGSYYNSVENCYAWGGIGLAAIGFSGGPRTNALNVWNFGAISGLRGMDCHDTGSGIELHGCNFESVSENPMIVGRISSTQGCAVKVFGGEHSGTNDTLALENTTDLLLYETVLDSGSTTGVWFHDGYFIGGQVGAEDLYCGTNRGFKFTYNIGSNMAITNEHTLQDQDINISAGTFGYIGKLYFKDGWAQNIKLHTLKLLATTAGSLWADTNGDGTGEFISNYIEINISGGMASGDTCAINLPSAAAGRSCIVCCNQGYSASTGRAVLTPHGTDTIIGATTLNFSQRTGSVDQNFMKLEGTPNGQWIVVKEYLNP